MRNTIRKGSKGYLVKLLRTWLNDDNDSDIFDDKLAKKVREWQREHRLFPDGIVGERTWGALVVRITPSIRIGDDDILLGAFHLNIDFDVMKALIEVESAGGGLDEYRRPVILYEPHVFWRNLVKEGKKPEQYAKGNEDILYKYWSKSKYVKGQDANYKRLERAAKIDEECAYRAVSMGLFQILGENYASCGFESAVDMFRDASDDEYQQLRQFCQFVENHKRMHAALKRRDFTTFARLYNGPAFEKNNYDKKLKKAAEKYR